jgi:hypothetical protein
MEFESLYQPQDESDALRPLLRGLYVELQRDPIRLPEIRDALIHLLEFLVSPLGRTDANCRAVDSFLGRDAAWDAERLPANYADILADMGGALHDTVSAPSIAANFESTPEQLLDRAKAL